MKRYDPEAAPSRMEWLSLSEDERIELAERYHREAGIELPNVHVHSTFHAIAENQLALEDATVQTTLARLMDEGLSRHDAVHAIGSVLAEHLFNLSRSSQAGTKDNAKYYRGLERLTARKWRDG